MKFSLAIGLWLLAASWAAAQNFASINPSSANERARGASIHPAVVRIVAPAQGSISYGSGTLVHVNDQMGLVLTNWHVINEATGPISVHFADGFYSLGSVRKVDRDWDLAAIMIKKPNVPAVALANQAPFPGEVLTIAGYGSGEYRAASGRCTQYVAPGTSFPYEMVEVAVSARQGDSGGPIFNSRGELAGVLFGEGHGRTSGSYCGRVKWFLSSVLPNGTEFAQQVKTGAESNPRPAVAQPLVAAGSTRDPSTIASPTGQPILRAVPLPNGLPSAATAPKAPSAPRSPEPQILGWQELAGETTADQVKTVLAAVGALAILLRGLRWLSAERQTA